MSCTPSRSKKRSHSVGSGKRLKPLFNVKFSSLYLNFITPSFSADLQFSLIN